MNLFSIMCILLGILIDMGGHYLARWLEPPFWLDVIGTMAVAILLGPLAGAFTGTMSVFIVQLITGGHVVYSLVGAVIGVVVGFLFPRKNPGDLFVMITVGLLAGLIGAAICIPFNFLYYDGSIGNRWGDAMNEMLQNSVRDSWMTNFLSQLFIDLPDKVLSILLASLLANLGQIFHTKHFDRRKPRILSMILVLAMGASLIPASESRAEDKPVRDFESDYEMIMYGSKDGLASSEVNTVAQTADGYIWIGTYSGLYRYDGVKIEETRLDVSINNVLYLYVDSQERLWILTNDSGVFLYDLKTNDCRQYWISEGLASSSVRAICEDPKGNIYIGTSLAISKIQPDGQVITFTDWKDFYYTESLACLPDGSIAGVANSGSLYRIKDDMILEVIPFTREEGIFYRSVACRGNEVLVGTSKNMIDRYQIVGDKLEYQNYINIPNADYVNRMLYDEDQGGLFVCCENNMGFVSDKTGKYQDMSEDEFYGAVEDVFVDDQDNVWFASSKQGLIKFSRTPFQNLFKKAMISSEVANATLISDGKLYIGTDAGLRVIDLDTMKQVGVSYQKELEGMRIRSIMKDSKGNLWFSTYSDKGLICVDPKEKFTCFNEKTNGFLGTQCRTAIELSDGRILAASKSGLTFIRDGVVDKTLGVDDGLNNTMILCLMERDDGSIMAGSDGDGIYIIENDKVVRNLGFDEGLFSSVIMRIIKCDYGYYYVASDSLYHDNGTQIRQMLSFPYSNNYDVIVDNEGYCWITSSAGLFKVNELELISMAPLDYVLLNENWGFETKFTANSWNFLDDNMLYLCCTDGIRRLNIHEYDTFGGDYELQLKSIDFGKTVLQPVNGQFTIPATAERINFNIAVNNFSLSNPMVRYYLEGTKDEGITCTQSEILPLSFTDLPHGEYKLHIEVVGDDGMILREKVVPVTKEALMYEYLSFRVYFSAVLLALVLYFCWLFLTIHKKTTSIIGLQKEISTDPMTGLLNKGGSQKALTQACENETGILMMIDLDSFKLVNDLYGHDMGDRILIRFSELIRGALRAEDITGRIGGDEFIGFMRNTVSEEEVERVTRYLNRELMASAKEYMGEDMNIPLGTSIGAVRVPMEGRDFGELSKLADKALYVVKQNGKHGYSFYQKRGNAVDQDEEDSDNNSFDQIKQIIGERNEGKGAFLVNFDKLQVIYKFMNRNDKVTENTTGFFRFRLEGEAVSDTVRDTFEDYLLVNLRKNDVLSRYSGSFYVLCVGRKDAVFEDIAKRLADSWNEDLAHQEVQVHFETETVGE